MFRHLENFSSLFFFTHSNDSVIITSVFSESCNISGKYIDHEKEENVYISVDSNSCLVLMEDPSNTKIGFIESNEIKFDDGTNASIEQIP